MNVFSRARNYLRQPEEADFSFQGSWPSALGISIAIVFLVYFFSLRASDFDLSYQLLYSFLFGVITLVISLFNDLIISRIFPNWFNEDQWTIGKSILYIIWNFLSITIANMAFFVYRGWASFSFNSFYQVTLITLSIGAIPIIILALIRHNQKLDRRLQEAIALNQQLKNTPTQTGTGTAPLPLNQTIAQIFIPSNQQNVSIPLSNFLYATSEKNYFRIILDGEEELLIRNTLKNLEEALQNHPTIIRCHRAFVVETKKVTSVSGNAQGYRLSLEGCAEEIPVSRSYISHVKKLIG